MRKKNISILPYLLCLATLRVISDPYGDIDYAAVNSYEIENEPLEDCIGYHESDGWNERQDNSLETAEDENPGKKTDAQIPWNPVFWWK